MASLYVDIGDEVMPAITVIKRLDNGRLRVSIPSYKFPYSIETPRRLGHRRHRVDHGLEESTAPHETIARHSGLMETANAKKARRPEIALSTITESPRISPQKRRKSPRSTDSSGRQKWGYLPSRRFSIS
ncbi:hypothetical protein BPNPMPFG_002387 [Mesorhizobium sp. AR07]|uniref:hypothetical protein n=1 Tax=Mesorhizobium sp. AR07 TaxID=2865838 RepID=UPI00215F18C8|nr:hypothetical protein [Mesorhizobium sp. AR07]UVK46689.1 hypothetical protein BPNPMPFG_002387 [Mesorhizobium sp. AR07]